MIVLGLTGSIGMGKTTTAGLFEALAIPVHDSDEAVHRLYRGPAAHLVEAEFPGVSAADGSVDRERLARAVLDAPGALKRLEAIVHPLVRADADAFVARHKAAGKPLVVLDIPLLFETGGRSRVDKVAVVTAPAAVQRKRVLARRGMTPERFEAILARQVPDAEKIARADFIIDTASGIEAARHDVKEIVRILTESGGAPGG